MVAVQQFDSVEGSLSAVERNDIKHDGENMPEQEEKEESLQRLDAPETLVEKDVTMLAYPQNPDWSSKRTWANEVLEEDAFENVTDEKEEVEVKWELGKGKHTTKLSDWKFETSRAKKVAGQLKRSKVEGISMNVKQWAESTQRFSESDLAGLLLDSVWEDMPINLTGGLTPRTHNRGWDLEDTDYYVRFWNISMDEMKVLAKESERSSDDRYETMGEYPCFRFRIKMKGPGEEYLDTWTEEVIEQLHKLISANDGIGKVRYTSCTIREEREGDCYNV